MTPTNQTPKTPKTPKEWIKNPQKFSVNVTFVAIFLIAGAEPGGKPIFLALSALGFLINNGWLLRLPRFMFAWLKPILRGALKLLDGDD